MYTCIRIGTALFASQERSIPFTIRIYILMGNKSDSDGRLEDAERETRLVPSNFANNFRRVLVPGMTE